LPPDASLGDDMEIYRDTKNGELTIIFDFRPCPGQVRE